MTDPTATNAANGTNGIPAEIAETPPRVLTEPQIPSVVVQQASGTEALILQLLEDPPTEATIKLMNFMWTHWGIKQWEDIALFTPKDVQEFFTEHFKDTSKLFQKKIEYIVAFARNNDISPGLTMRDVIDRVDGKADDKSVATTVCSSVSSDEKKKTVPALEKFSGMDEDYYHWRDAVINDLGRNGLGRFVLDDNAHELYNGQSESVFYALRSALSGGLAASHANTMHDAHDCNPRVLWTTLKEYYDTTLNRANINVWEIRRLLGLTLDPATTPLKFVSDMKECLQRLRTNKAKISEDNETLRAFLLVAIQDDDFDAIRDTIIEKPTRSIDELLADIRTKDSALQMKEGVRRLQGDGATAVARRTNSSSKKGGRVHDAIKNGRWVIPTFPPGWKQAVGPKIFKIMTDWRKSAIHDHAVQAALDDNFSFKVTPVSTGKNNHQKKARKATVTEDGDVAMEDASEKQSKRRRITLNKKNRVVTEVGGDN